MPRKSHERLIIFTRYPEPGTVKTKLIPELGEQGAADLQRRMTEHVLARAREAQNRRGFEIEVRFEGADEELLRAWLGEHLIYAPQDKIGLGGRMSRACRLAFITGCERVVIIGTDFPGIGPDILIDAFEGLKHRDFILGPAPDGRYYLIGLGFMMPNLFTHVEWGTGKVLEQTLDNAKKYHLSYSLLPTLRDIDRPEDLPIWKKIRDNTSAALEGQKISVIIPAFNNSDHIPAAIESAARGQHVEIIVVDGGSTDATREAARNAGATVLDSSPGKTTQMNLGAEKATGDILLFLQANSTLTTGYDSDVRYLLRQPNVVAGCFTLRIDPAGFGTRFVEQTTNFLSRRLKIIRSEQALFVKTAIFRETGGYPEAAARKESALAQRLRKKGKLVPSSLFVTTHTTP